ncbi:hypothetical protein AXM73_20850 [Salmonella enterica subsp. enterica]|nr:hypothetical protein [Salmonella enterica subsp. enterica serovar Manchester]EAM9253059.1 hypothetical protein [Salmonella enterica]EAW1744342.1 hypothetical protein [Salmonella enterica subsp. enterica]EBV0852921.1 hypothetical protein [Salmonella enterica subsp. enterica serovar Fulica]ECC3684025.1 hypothetical protein [Salmonella enterica subsp. enterica serovar Mikawasima]
MLAAFARPIHILLHTTGTTLTCGLSTASSDNMYLRDTTGVERSKISTSFTPANQPDHYAADHEPARHQSPFRAVDE